MNIIEKTRKSISTLMLVFLTIIGVSCAKDSSKSSSPAPVAAVCNPNLGPNSPGCNIQSGYCTTPGTVFVAEANTCVPQGSCPANYGYYNNQCTPGTIASLPQNGSNYQYGTGSCVAGQVYTYYGCLPTAGCPPNQGRAVGGNCVPALTIGSNGVPYGVGQYGQQGYQNNYYGANNGYNNYNGYSGYNGYNGYGNYNGYNAYNNGYGNYNGYGNWNYGSAYGNTWYPSTSSYYGRPGFNFYWQL